MTHLFIICVNMSMYMDVYIWMYMDVCVSVFVCVCVLKEGVTP